MTIINTLGNIPFADFQNNILDVNIVGLITNGPLSRLTLTNNTTPNNGVISTFSFIAQNNASAQITYAQIYATIGNKANSQGQLIWAVSENATSLVNYLLVDGINKIIQLYKPIYASSTTPSNSLELTPKIYVDNNIASINSSITAINSEISTINGEITTLQNQVSTINGQISTINSQLANAVFLTGATQTINSYKWNTQHAFLSVSLSFNPINISGDGTVYTVLFNVISRDQNSSYNSSTGQFTANFGGSGTRNFSYSGGITLIGVTALHTCYVVLNTNGGPYLICSAPGTAANALGELFLPFSMNLIMTNGWNASVQVIVSGGTKTVGLKGISNTPSPNTICSYFTGYFVG